MSRFGPQNNHQSLLDLGKVETSLADLVIPKLKLRIAVIGLGDCSLGQMIPFILRASDSWELVAVCSPSDSRYEVEKFRERFPNILNSVLVFAGVEDMVSCCIIDCAYIEAHVSCRDMTVTFITLAQCGVHVLKEGPAAIDLSGLISIQDIADISGVNLSTTSPSRHCANFNQFLSLLPQVGRIEFAAGICRVNGNEFHGNGWRNEHKGTLPGWGLVDLVLRALGDGSPAYITRAVTRCNIPRNPDVAEASLRIPHKDSKDGSERLIPCDLTMTTNTGEPGSGRPHGYALKVTGELGSLTMQGDTVVLSLNGQKDKSFAQCGMNWKVHRTMLAFHGTVEAAMQQRGHEGSCQIFSTDSTTIQTIERLCNAVGCDPSPSIPPPPPLSRPLPLPAALVSPASLTPPILKLPPPQEALNAWEIMGSSSGDSTDFETLFDSFITYSPDAPSRAPLDRPTNTSGSIAEVSKASPRDEGLSTAISPFHANMAMLKEYEKWWADEHLESAGNQELLALYYNSDSDGPESSQAYNTDGLKLLLYGIDVQPEDEVIFPLYISTTAVRCVITLRAKPVFCDILDNGNVSPDAILATITCKTKAIVIAHMWGTPCDMEAISKIKEENPHIYIIEDCSHAQGARYNGRLVGTLGDAAFWPIPCHQLEGPYAAACGVTLTKHREVYHRQLYWGHYKLCHIQTPQLYPSATSRGLRLSRAIANWKDSERNSPDALGMKNLYAHQISNALAGISFLKVAKICPASFNSAKMDLARRAMILRFVPEKAPRGLDRETLIQQLNDLGLEVCAPTTHVPLSLDDDPRLLVVDPSFRRCYPSHLPEGDIVAMMDRFPGAFCFHLNAIKLPVWRSDEDQEEVNRYLEGISSVAAWWMGISQL
ncbi:DegT/DnrJ/EryC1/StrS aminotransferase family-domain-containing protein [Lasiosphaeria hispida]|uniref:DegT/DnrJ/EryC1/StrS aminotransferase family-domain-containing protein n=1 Tax=Lasiosphaeria hispida TaxID=260671 RepID=A0AAJ0HIF0_9PEZI|nr:DegT/DnrJ/EryC1/StrS aminotransferase family-domain-containing protein [Lasiosphaeria hispida]